VLTSSHFPRSKQECNQIKSNHKREIKTKEKLNNWIYKRKPESILPK